MINDSYFIINNYLNMILKDNGDILAVLEDLELFCVENNYFLNDDIIKRLLEDNSNLYEEVGKLVAKNIMFIRNDTIDDYINSYIAKRFIYIYCDLDKVNIDYNTSSSLPYYGYALPPFNNKKEERLVVIKAQSGNKEAKKELIMRNIKLIIHIARKYMTNIIWLDDLVEEGIEGLLIALNKFDINGETKFSSYATIWIKQRILRYVITRQNSFRTLEENTKLFGPFKEVYEELTTTLKREPTYKEIGDKLKVKPEKVEILIRTMTLPVSLDEPLNDCDELKGTDTIIDPMINIEEAYELKDAISNVDELLYSRNLTDKEMAVIKMLFGFTNGGDTMKQVEIARVLGISHQRVEQLKKSGLKKLKESSETKKVLKKEKNINNEN